MRLLLRQGHEWYSTQCLPRVLRTYIVLAA
jgi:hypothetical protein